MAEAGRGARAAGAEASVRSAVGGGSRGRLWEGLASAPGPRVGCVAPSRGVVAGGRGRGGVRVAKTLEMEDEGLQRTAGFKPWRGPILRGRLRPRDCRVPGKRDPFLTVHSFWPQAELEPLLPRPRSPSLPRAVVTLLQRPDAHPGQTALFTQHVLCGEKARAPLT